MRRQIKIGGHTYKILDVRGKEAGQAFTGQNIITLDMSQPQSQLESTLLHEILEVLSEMYKLELDEQEIRILETALYDVIKNNKLFK